MKLTKYCVYLTLIPAMLCGLASCSDNDEPAVVEKAPLTLGDNVDKVKIGAENRCQINVAAGTEYFDAYSLNPSVLEVVRDENGNLFMEGKANGNTSVVVTDGNNELKRFPVMVYTTDVLKLSQNSYDFNVRLGKSASSNGEIEVAEGNGEYTIESDNKHVTASINSTTGVISFVASASIDPYTATLTVTDISGLTAELKVNVIPDLEPFTQDELNSIMSNTTNTISEYCYYFNLSKEISTKTENGLTTTGWSYLYKGWSGETTYRFEFSYPEGTQVGQEVDGKYVYEYYNITKYDGKVKILQDDADKFVAIFWHIDTKRETIDTAYMVWIK